MNRRDRFKKFGAIAGLLCSAIPLIGAEEEILFEGFETEGNGDRYILIGGHDDGGDNYIARREAFQPGTTVYGGTLGGTWMMGFQDLDFAPIESRINGDQYAVEDMGVREGRLKFLDINTSGYGNLRLEMSAANLGGNEPNDNLRIRVRFDGGDWIEIGGFKSNSSNFNTSWYVGPADTIILAANPNRLFRFFSDWSWPIPAHGDSMELQITVEGNAGNEDHHLDNIRLVGDPEVSLVTAAFAQGQVTEPESGGVVNTLTVTINEPAPAGGATFDLQPFDRRAEYSLSLPEETLTIPEGATSATMDVEVVQDGQYTGTKTIDLYVSGEGYSTSFARVLIDNATPKPDLVITEVLNVVPGLEEDDVIGDANGDGIWSSGLDQFIEIVNFSDVPADLSLMRIGDDLADRHEITDGTILLPDEVLVVFGGSDPVGAFGGAKVQIATAGGNGLGFNITSREETPYLNAQFGAAMDDVIIAPQRSDFLVISEALPQTHNGFGVSSSVHRLTKGPGDPAYVLDIPAHMHSVIDGAGERLFSPGTWFDGTTYFEVANEITVDIDQDSISEDAGANAATGTITLSQAAPAGGMDVTLETSGVVVNEDGSFAGDELDLDSLVVTVPEGSSQATFRIGAVNDGVLDGDQVVVVNARGGDYVLGGFDQITVTDVAEVNVDVMINEIMVDVEDDGFDVNGDGVANDGLGDRFVELVNQSDNMVNLSGWELWWETSGVFGVERLMHVFPQGTWVDAGGSIVVFGRAPEGASGDAAFGGAIVQGAHSRDGTTKANGLDLEIDGTYHMRVYNEHGFVVDEIFEGSFDALSQGSSATWAPDPENPEVDILTSHFILDFNAYSPGFDVEGGVQSPFAGNGIIRLPMVFTQVNFSSGSGWFFDPTFGWVYTGAFAEAATWDIPWVYLDGEGYWFIYEESVSNGFFWAYDYEHSTWIYTGYGLYPWVWSNADANWIQH